MTLGDVWYLDMYGIWTCMVLGVLGHVWYWDMYGIGTFMVLGHVWYWDIYGIRTCVALGHVWYWDMLFDLGGLFIAVAFRRKQKENFARFAYEHLLSTYTWRAQMFPLSDTDPEILEDLAKGMMYWTARDK